MVCRGETYTTQALGHARPQRRAVPSPMHREALPAGRRAPRKQACVLWSSRADHRLVHSRVVQLCVASGGDPSAPRAINVGNTGNRQRLTNYAWHVDLSRRGKLCSRMGCARQSRS